jgi:hypothetical protein
MKKALTRSRPLKKPAPKTILDLTAGRTVVARSLEAMAAEAMASKLNAVRAQAHQKVVWGTIKQAMAHYDCDKKTIYTWRRNGELESKKLPGGIRVRLK